MEDKVLKVVSEDTLVRTERSLIDNTSKYIFRYTSPRFSLLADKACHSFYIDYITGF